MVCPGLGTTTAPLSWPVAFGTSSSGCIQPQVLFWTRVAIAGVVFGHLAYHFAINFKKDGFYYFIYLTHWSFLLETAYLVILPFVDKATQNEKNYSLGFGLVPGGGNEKQPGLVSVAMVLFMIVQPLSMLVVILYWTLDKPIWKFCDLNGGVEPCYDWPDYLGFFVHGIDFIILTVSFFLGRVPYQFSNCLWFTVFALLYLVWTIFHYIFKIGAPPGKEAECAELGYTLSECPIYNVLDWHHPEKTGLIAVGVMVFCFVLIGIYRFFAWLRDRA